MLLFYHAWHRRLTICGVVLLCAVLSSQRMHCQEAERKRNSVELYLFSGRHPALNDSLVAAVRQRVASILAQAASRGSSLRDPAPDLDAWLADQALKSLTPDLCRKFGLDRAEATIVMTLNYSNGTYDAAAVEYVSDLDVVGEPRHAMVLQREMLPDAMARLAMQTWCPTGDIVGRSGKDFAIDFQTFDALEQLPELTRLPGPGCLQVYRKVDRGDQAHRSVWPDNCLVIQKIEGRYVMASMAVTPENQIWFDMLGDPRVRYRARLVPPAVAHLAVKLRTQDDGRPCEGFSVFSSNVATTQRNQLGDWRGRTDASGSLVIETRYGSPTYVSVPYAGGHQTRVYVAGINQKELQFEVPREDSRVDLQQLLTRVEEQVGDVRTLMNDWSARLEQAAKVDESDAARVVVREARELIEGLDWNGVRAQLAQVREASRQAGYQDLVALADRSEAIALAVERSASIVDFEEAEKSITVRKLRKEIQEAQAGHRWNQMAELLHELVLVDSNDAAAKRTLATLEKVLPAATPQHAAARAAIDSTVGISSVDILIARWKEIQPALATIVTNRDSLKLIELKERLDLWGNLATDEAARLAKKGEADAQLQARERAAVVDRGKQLESLLQELFAIRKSADEITRGVFGP